MPVYKVEIKQFDFFFFAGEMGQVLQAGLELAK